LKSKCLFSRIEAVAIPLHQEVLVVALGVPVAPAPVAVPVIRFSYQISA